MASLSPTFLTNGCLLLFLLALTSATLAFGSFHVANVRSLLPNHDEDVCSSPKDFEAPDKTTRLKVAHRHGACSPLMKSHRKPRPSHGQILAADQLRVDSIHRRTSSSSGRSRKRDPLSSSKIPAMSGSVVNTGNYVVEIGIGSPAKEFTVIFDTGSDVTWVQCKPCLVHCYRQHDPLFDPSQSSTYANVSCASPYCEALNAHGCIKSTSTCLYGVQYGDNSYTIGFYAQDTLTLGASTKLPGFRFGCGEINRGLFGEAAGLMGLGRGEESLTSQAYSKFGGVFAYCLPASASSTGYLTFGADAPTANAALTPMLTDPDTPTFYYLEMTGIAVGGQKLPIAPAVFTDSGTLIDSGTVITRLAPDAYSALRSAFKKAMSAYKPAAAFSILDTCYDFTGLDNVSIPTIELQFSGGTNLEVDVSGIMYGVSVSQLCLAFAGNDDPSSTAIIGNMQQKTFNVLYDVSRKMIGFCPGAC